MAIKKRYSRSQPIRKRKKKSSKQSLEKAVQRKDANEQARLQKIARVDARIKSARLQAFHSSLKSSQRKFVLNEPPKSASSFVKSLAENKNSHHATQSDDDTSDSDDIHNAYENLVHSLAQPLYETPSQPTEPDSEPTPGPPQNAHMLNGDKTPAQPGKKGSENDSQPFGNVSHLALYNDDPDDPDWTGDVESELRETVQRDNSHFGLTSLPSDPPTTVHDVIAKWPRLRMVAAVPQHIVTELRDAVLSETPVSLGVQPSTMRNWQTHPSYRSAMNAQKHSPFLKSIAATLRSYSDIFMSAALDSRTCNTVRAMYVAHIVAHVLRARARVIKNDSLLRSFSTTDPVNTNIRDQGFSRARAVIIAPMRNVAYDVIRLVIRLVRGPQNNDGFNVFNIKRFEEEFATDDHDDYDKSPHVDKKRNGPVEDTMGRPKANKKIREKPSDYRYTFRGNIDDDFKLGIAFSKRSIKLFADFYDSDLIVASPLGLRRESAAKAVGQDRHSKAMREKRKKDQETEWVSGIDSKIEKRETHDNDDGFLSSIEICVVDGADVFSMQNWDTLKRTMGMLNKIPNNTRDTDFSRVREWCLDNLMSKFRQTIILSRYRKSEFVALYRQLENHAGKVQLIESPLERGSMVTTTLKIRQTFFKVPKVSSPANGLEKRIDFFFGHTFPIVQAFDESQVLLFVPSYFDFVRVRNRLIKIAEEETSLRFSSICEYSGHRDVTRARCQFYDRLINLVIMTERFQFFRRQWIRGANTIVWFGLPENCEFYPEVLNMTAEAIENGCEVQSIALYDQFDAFNLERIVGVARCREMIAETSDTTYVFT